MKQLPATISDSFIDSIKKDIESLNLPSTVKNVKSDGSILVSDQVPPMPHPAKFTKASTATGLQDRNSTTIITNKSLKLRATESESAIDFSATADSLTVMANNERRQRFHRSARRALSYEKAELRKYFPKIGDASESPKVKLKETDTSSQPFNTNLQDSAVSSQFDRYVSTSYAESLHALAAQSPSQLAPLPEQRKSDPTENRNPYLPPVSQILDYYDQPSITVTGETSDFPLDDMNFIQYTSTDLLYLHKNKAAKMIGRYLMGGLLGEGSYGKVKEGFCSETVRRVAIKIMKQTRLKKIPNGEQNVAKEISLLKKLRHKNVIELMDVITNPMKQKTYVIFEYCATTVSEMINKSSTGKLPLSQAQRYILFDHFYTCCILI